jgi:hypothetical protein
MARLLDPLTLGHTGCCSHAAMDAPQHKRQPQQCYLCQQQVEQHREQQSMAVVVAVLVVVVLLLLLLSVQRKQ